MYNRYTPQSDGSYKRKTVADPVLTHPQNRHNGSDMDPAPKYDAPPLESSLMQKERSAPHERPKFPDHAKSRAPRPITERSAGAFLRDLLPRDLDTGDLLIIILLLLMAADSTEDQGNALLTLALYLFM